MLLKYIKKRYIFTFPKLCSIWFNIVYLVSMATAQTCQKHLKEHQQWAERQRIYRWSCIITDHSGSLQDTVCVSQCVLRSCKEEKEQGIFLIQVRAQLTLVVYPGMPIYTTERGASLGSRGEKKHKEKILLKWFVLMH